MVYYRQKGGFAMTVGERIQFHRKRLQLSQEELGQKLLVSRQTVSQWETDQTLPSVDSLMRLKDIFGVSVDEILFPTETVDLPMQTISHGCSEADFAEIYKATHRRALLRSAIVICVMAVVIVGLIGTESPSAGVGFVLGYWVLYTVSRISSLVKSRKSWRKHKSKVLETHYEYVLYEDRVVCNLYRENTLTGKTTIPYTEIGHTWASKNFMLFMYGGSSYLVRIDQLNIESPFYRALITAGKNKTVGMPLTGTKKTTSTALFWASIAALPVGISVAAAISPAENFINNLWLLFVFAVIPVASIVVGYRLKASGYRASKNIVVGFIMAILLCIYGLLGVIAKPPAEMKNSAVYLAGVEQRLEIDIPVYTNAATYEYPQGVQASAQRMMVFSSTLSFDEINAEAFEATLTSSDKWMTVVPTELIGISSPGFASDQTDYIAIFNADTHEFNVLPAEQGKYRFIQIIYCPESNEMYIMEYDVTYVP